MGTERSDEVNGKKQKVHAIRGKLICPWRTPSQRQGRIVLMSQYLWMYTVYTHTHRTQYFSLVNRSVLSLPFFLIIML